MKIIRTDLTDLTTLPPFDQEQVYNGLDCCVTHDVFAATHPQLDHHTERTYAFSRALQGPVLEMRIRGVLVDMVRRANVVDEICDEIDWVEGRLNQLVLDGVGMSEFNWRSNAHLQALFYGELGISPINKQGRPTTDRGAREKLEGNPLATQLIRHINALTELGDKLSVLRTEIDADGRIRTAITLLGQIQGDLVPAYPNSALEGIYRTLRSLYDQSSSQTPDTNSASSTPSPANPSASGPSSGTCSETELTSMLANLETHIRLLQDLYGQRWDGLGFPQTRLLLSNLFTATITIASCVKSLAMAQTTAAAPTPLPSKPSSPSTSSPSSSPSTSPPSLRIKDGKRTLTLNYDDWDTLFRSLAGNVGSLDVVAIQPHSEKLSLMTLNVVLLTW